MATMEERLAFIEHEHAALRKTIELQTIAIGALVNKAMLEKLNEKMDKSFDALIAHDRLTNERLGDIQTQIVELDGKIVGLQVETRQSFRDVKDDLSAMDARFDAVATKDDLSAMDARFDTMDARFEQIMLLLTALAPKPE